MLLNIIKLQCFLKSNLRSQSHRTPSISIRTRNFFSFAIFFRIFHGFRWFDPIVSHSALFIGPSQVAHFSFLGEFSHFFPLPDKLTKKEEISMGKSEKIKESNREDKSVLKYLLDNHPRAAEVFSVSFFL